MFSPQTITEIETVARQEGLDPAALLAVAEVESGGKAFAFVGGRKEPLIRFEGHYFDQLIAPVKRAEARQAGLADPKAGKIANPRTQAARWAFLEKAMKLDKDAALKSVSWGIGQVMGAHWKALGYASVQHMADEARDSVAGQVRLMVRYIRRFGLTDMVARRDWEAFARAYNGPLFRKYHYDTKLAAAYARHANTKLKDKAARGSLPRKAAGVLQIGMRGEAVRDLQRQLTAAGFAVSTDGIFGLQTELTVRRAQRTAGLHVDGIAGRKTMEALAMMLPGTPTMPKAVGRLLALFALFRRLVPKWLI